MFNQQHHVSRYQFGDLVSYHGDLCRVMGSSWHVGINRSTYTLGCFWPNGKRVVWHLNADEAFISIPDDANLIDLAR